MGNSSNKEKEGIKKSNEKPNFLKNSHDQNYMNALLQCLFYTNDFKLLLLNKNPNIKKGHYPCFQEMRNLFIKLQELTDNNGIKFDNLTKYVSFNFPNEPAKSLKSIMEYLKGMCNDGILTPDEIKIVCIFF